LLEKEQAELAGHASEPGVQSSPRKAILSVSKVNAVPPATTNSAGQRRLPAGPSPLSLSESNSNSSSSSAAAAPPAAGTPSFNNTRLQLFYRKLYRLAHIRLSQLCLQLGATDIQQRSWDVLVEILANEASLRLLYHRHLDTAIMCTIYCVSRVISMSSRALIPPARVQILSKEDRQLKFKEIISKYMLQPQSDESHYKEIDVSDRMKDKHIDIINFYNLVFIHDILPITKQIQPPQNAASPALVPPPAVPASSEPAPAPPTPVKLPEAPLPQPSPLRFPSKSKVYVQPIPCDPQFSPQRNLILIIFFLINF